MNDATGERLDRIEAHLTALTNMLLSQIAAADIVAPGLTASTNRFAEDQRLAMVREGRHLAALMLGDLMDAVVEVAKE